MNASSLGEKFTLPGGSNGEPIVDSGAIFLLIVAVGVLYSSCRSSSDDDSDYEELSDDEDGAGCFSCVCAILCCCFRRGRVGLPFCRCCGSLAAFIILLLAVWRGVTRNLYCNPDALAGFEPPYGGDMLPRNVSLVERKHFFQLTKLVDVYVNNDDGRDYVGYFYDINLFFIMRFGFSDPQNRIWFEARYASWVSRFKPVIEYIVQRCDAGSLSGRGGTYFQVKENFWIESWFCIMHCTRVFDISKRDADKQIDEALVPPNDFGLDPEVRAVYSSTLVPVVRSKTDDPTYGFGFNFRHKWRMALSSIDSGDELGAATQHFASGDQANNYNVLSRWEVTGRPEIAQYLPAWAQVFMAALADIEEEAR